MTIGRLDAKEWNLRVSHTVEGCVVLSMHVSNGVVLEVTVANRPVSGFATDVNFRWLHP
jgi:hypothetical protein